MTSVLIEEARQIHENAHLSDDDLARATGAAPSTVRAWLAGSRSPTGERAERVNELSALVERLMRVIDPADISLWLRKSIPALGDGSQSTSSQPANTATRPALSRAWIVLARADS